MESDFEHIRSLSNSAPARKLGPLRAIWPEIKKALETGHTLKAICEALNRDGLKISYSRLCGLVAQLKQETAQPGPGLTEAGTPRLQSDPHSSRPDPAEAIRAQRAKSVVFEHDPFGGTKKGLTS